MSEYVYQTTCVSRENTFAGKEEDTPEVGAVHGAVLGLSKTMPFRNILENMEECILRKLDNGSDVLPYTYGKKRIL